MQTKFIVLLFLLYISTGIVNAQIKDTSSIVCEKGGCCCGNDPTPAGVMISHVHLKNEWMISYRYMSMNMSGINHGADAANQSEVLQNYTGSPNLMQMRMHMLMAMYGVSNKLTVMAMFNYTSDYMEMTMPMGKEYHRHSMMTSGIGDTKLYALYALKKTMLSQLLLNAGINLPTGIINLKGPIGAAMYSNQRYPYAMQLGSGTVDILPGLTYLTQKNKLTFSTQVQGIIRIGFNNNGYKLGNEVTVNGWGAWQWLSVISSTLRLEGNLSTKISGKDKSFDTYQEPSANPSNYGGKRLTAYIGTTFQPKRSFLKKNRLSIEYGLPFYQNLNGYQMTINNSLYFAWSLTF